MMKEEEIIERFRNPDYPAIIIAEIGSNFDGSLDVAIEMIKIAADAGCDFAKFQLFSADALVPLKSHAHTVLSPLELNREWIPNLVDACLENDIGFCASPFDFDAVDRLFDNGGAPFYKIASPEVHDIPLIEFCLSLPSRWKLRHGRTRYILRKYLKGQVSDIISDRPNKANLQHGLLENIKNQDVHKINAQLKCIHPFLNDIIDLDKLEKCLDKIKNSGRSTDGELTAILAFYSINFWLNKNSALSSD